MLVCGAMRSDNESMKNAAIARNSSLGHLRTGSSTDLEDPAMKSPFAKAPEVVRQKQIAVGIMLCVMLLALLLLPSLFGGSDGDATLNHLRLDKFPETFRISVIADLDQSSKKDSPKGSTWHSLYMTATLRRSGESYEIEWDQPSEVSTTHNEAGRGCELSELVRYGNSLYTFDDRTGIMFEVMHPGRSDASPAPYLVPRHIFMEGDGNSNDKGLKVEWATVKDGLLYVGSFGKEYTNNKGEVLHTNNMWAVTVSKEGVVHHLDWKPHFDALRSSLGYSFPGYMIHEAITWSPHHRQWFIFPRRLSAEAYDDVADEKRGGNTLITASHDFSEIKAFTVGKRTPERGFSTAKFLPGSRDGVIVALKSEENAAAGTQRTFLTIYGESSPGANDWRVLLDEVPLPIEKKFEGLEILSAGGSTA